MRSGPHADPPRQIAQIIEGIATYRDYVPGVRQHHERYDGKGYPEGLSRDEVCLDARIIAVADTYEAMTSDRPYHPALSPADALEAIRREAGSQFDPAVVAALARALDAAPTSSTARVPGLPRSRIPGYFWEIKRTKRLYILPIVCLLTEKW